MMTPYHRKQKKMQRISPLGWLGIGIGVCVFGLVFHNTHDVLFGTRLSVSPIKNGAVYTDSYLPITGKTRSPQSLTINDRPITLTKDGTFNEVIILSEGYNRVSIRLVDRFGKTQEKLYHLVLEKQDSSLAKK